MGFFSNKATCSACDKEVSLDRYKIKQGWLCPQCYKTLKSKGLNMDRVSLDEMKECIIDNEELKKQDEKNLPSRAINIAEEMYEYCLEHQFALGVSKISGVDHFNLIAQQLLPDEKFLMAFIGMHHFVSPTNHQNYYVYAVSKDRILMARKSEKSGNENFQIISLNDINEITYKINFLFGILTIDAKNEKINIALDKAQVKNIHTQLIEILNS